MHTGHRSLDRGCIPTSDSRLSQLWKPDPPTTGLLTGGARGAACLRVSREVGPRRADVKGYHGHEKADGTGYHDKLDVEPTLKATLCVEPALKATGVVSKELAGLDATTNSEVEPLKRLPRRDRDHAKQSQNGFRKAHLRDGVSRTDRDEDVYGFGGGECHGIATHQSVGMLHFKELSHNNVTYLSLVVKKNDVVDSGTCLINRRSLRDLDGYEPVIVDKNGFDPKISEKLDFHVPRTTAWHVQKSNFNLRRSISHYFSLLGREIISGCVKQRGIYVNMYGDISCTPGYYEWIEDVLAR
ncbi:hypothetical protein KSS87_019471 [Heliosperma pusillum]|nr:hypothetical protein KSS87_019471 [Heliosperma pusillum]